MISAQHIVDIHQPRPPGQKPLFYKKNFIFFKFKLQRKLDFLLSIHVLVQSVIVCALKERQDIDDWL